MDAPKCKLCGERHYGLCTSTKHTNEVARVAPAGVGRPKGIPPSTVLNTADVAQRLERPPNALVAQRTERPASNRDGVGSNPTERAKFDRNAYHRDYMRDYMRKRRAKEPKE